VKPQKILTDPVVIPVAPDQQIISQSSSSTAESDIDEPDELDDFVVTNVQLVAERVLSAALEDREEATQAINRIKKLIDSQNHNIHGGSLQRLLQAIQTRADINNTSVKMMEACAKVLTARKAGKPKNITNTTTNTTSLGNQLITVLEKGQRENQ